MIDQTLTTPPTAPSSNDIPTFRTRFDAFIIWIATFVSQLTTVISQINNTATTINEKEVSAISAEANATSAQVIATQKATIATDQATIAINSASQANASAQVCAAYANMQWTGFGVTDGELIVSIADASVSTPSIVDGEFIITLGV
ncbi:hypothetical protein [Sulfurospirillum cavolei]|uniref:hypothetical protein n=1 Tax=Sulfurospirillum cavolei TaxID=366522 RepID=UPI003FA29481